MKCFGIVSYFGLAYNGFQRQRNGLPSVQAELERALSYALGQETLIKAAGRTDSGVNAIGQTFSFSAPRLLDIDLLNHLLPQDIKVTYLTECDANFDARHSSIGKVYEYRFTIMGRDPFLVGRIAQLEMERFDKDAFLAALRHFEGEHDFQNFTTKREDVDNFIRFVQPIEVAYSDNGGTVTFRSNGFMTYQIRLMMGAAIKCAGGRMDPSEIPALLNARPRHIVSYKAPAEGLYLLEVLYGKRP